MLRAFWDAAAAVDPGTALDKWTRGGSCATASPDELEALWREAELSEVAVSALDVEASYEDFDDLWTPFLAGIDPLGANMAPSIPLRTGRRSRGSCAPALGNPAGPFTLTARAFVVRGAPKSP